MKYKCALSDSYIYRIIPLDIDLRLVLGVPRCIRMDRGTENGTIEDIQASLRWDHADDIAGSRSMLYGCSHRNQVGSLTITKS